MKHKLLYFCLLLLPFINLFSQNCIETRLDNISGNTNYIKFKNNCDKDVRVFFTVNDGGKLLQEETSVFIRKGDENAFGPYHCSANTKINVSKITDINNSQIVSYNSKQLNLPVTVDLNNLNNVNARVFALIAEDAKKSGEENDWNDWKAATNKTAMDFLDKARRDFVRQKKQERAEVMAQRAALSRSGNYNGSQQQFNSKAYNQLQQINSSGWGGH